MDLSLKATWLILLLVAYSSQRSGPEGADGCPPATAAAAAAAAGYINATTNGTGGLTGGFTGGDGGSAGDGGEGGDDGDGGDGGDGRREDGSGPALAYPLKAVAWMSSLILINGLLCLLAYYWRCFANNYLHWAALATWVLMNLQSISQFSLSFLLIVSFFLS